MLYSVEWNRANKEKVRNQLYTAEHMTHKLEELEKEGAYNIRIRSFADENELKATEIMFKFPEKVRNDIENFRIWYKELNSFSRATVDQQITGYLECLISVELMHNTDFGVIEKYIKVDDPYNR